MNAKTLPTGRLEKGMRFGIAYGMSRKTLYRSFSTFDETLSALDYVSLERRILRQISDEMKRMGGLQKYRQSIFFPVLHDVWTRIFGTRVKKGRGQRRNRRNR